MSIRTILLSKYVHHPLQTVHKNCIGIVNLNSFNQYCAVQVYAAVCREVSVGGEVQGATEAAPVGQDKKKG